MDEYDFVCVVNQIGAMGQSNWQAFRSTSLWSRKHRKRSSRSYRVRRDASISHRLLSTNDHQEDNFVCVVGYAWRPCKLAGWLAGWWNTCALPGCRCQDPKHKRIAAKSKAGWLAGLHLACRTRQPCTNHMLDAVTLQVAVGLLCVVI